MAEIQSEEHASWLAASLENPNRKLWIAEREHIPVGTVRADLSNGIWNLSWTVAPESRGCGAGKAIVAAAARSISGPVRAEIKTYNVASARIAVHAGMQLVRQENDTLYFERPCPDST